MKAPPVRRWQDWANVLLGLWLFASSWIVVAGTYDIVARAVGALVVIAAALALRAPTLVLAEWACIALGAALVVAPPLFGYATGGAAAWNTYLSGLLVIVLASWALDRVRRSAPQAGG